MGITKIENFTIEQNKMAVIAKALGHPARIAIIEYLLKIDACICGDIVNEIPLAQPTVSQHLKELKNAGVIKGEITGKSICYCIDDTTLTYLKEYFTNISEELNKKKNICC